MACPSLHQSNIRQVIFLMQLNFPSDISKTKNVRSLETVCTKIATCTCTCLDLLVLSTQPPDRVLQKPVKLVNITFHPHVILIFTVSATGQELICPEGTAQQLIMMDYDRFLLD